ncbi:hypothetical protein [uncultured Tolumonas sp.]|uniref:hypothetical protein n=1 Tax=uncultured Tolumonas sp. TaxID=263765 RepID=UPI002A0A3A3C|nr:hypothetical protein [uncultured Tolumonas sp.]
MTTEELKTLLESGFTISNWTYISLIIVCALSGFFGAFFSSYIKQKGKNFATKEDFNDLKSQTADLAEVTEAVKTEIASNSWKASKKWELQYKIYIEVLEALSTWRMSIQKIIDESFESDGNLKSSVNREKIESIVINVQKAFDNLARIEAISEIALSSEQSESIRTIKQTATIGSSKLDGREAFDLVITQIKTLESQLAKTAKAQLF